MMQLNRSGAIYPASKISGAHVVFGLGCVGPRCPMLSPLGFVTGHLGPDVPRYAHLGFYWAIWMTQTAFSNWDSTGPNMHNRGPYVTCLSASFPFEFETCLP